MGGSYIQEFFACGGTIGRSLTCDWPLPDSKRYISSEHAMVDYQGGCYYLIDLSRNGIFINGSDVPVGKGNPQRLFDGDTIRMGEFEIKTALVDDSNEADSDSLSDSIVRAQMVQEDESVETPLLADDQIRDDHALDAALVPGDNPGELSAISPIPADLNIAEQLLQDSTNEFLASAGLNPDDYRGMEPKTLLKNAARLLSEYTEGVHSLLLSKDKALSSLNVIHDNRTGASNPLRAADRIDDALRLLLSDSTGIKGSKHAEAAFDELLRHEQAVVTAMREALADYIEHFEPGALEKLFAQQKQRGGNSGNGFRELYAEAYQGLAQPNRFKLPQRFDEQFARTYELETTD